MAIAGSQQRQTRCPENVLGFELRHPRTFQFLHMSLGGLFIPEQVEVGLRGDEVVFFRLAQPLDLVFLWHFGLGSGYETPVAA